MKKNQKNDKNEKIKKSGTDMFSKSQSHIIEGDPVFSSKEYKRSRIAYTFECGFAYFGTILIGGAFLAKLLNNMGIPDDQVGIISSLGSLAFLIQLISIWMVTRINNTKRTVILFQVLAILLFGATYLIPFIDVPLAVKTILVFICVLGGMGCKYLVIHIYYRWGNSFVHPGKRGSFSAVKEMTSLAGGIVVSLAAGAMIDRYEREGNLAAGFKVMAILLFVIAAADLISLLCINNEDKAETQAQKKSLSDVLHATFGNKAFMATVYLHIGLNVATYLTTGFLGTYETQELALTVGSIQVISMIGNGSRFFLSRPFGKYSDKTSFAKGYALALVLMAAAFLCVAFTTPRTWWLIIAYSVLYNVASAGHSANSYNMGYSYVGIEFFTQAQAIKFSLAGVAGFLTSLGASRILKAVQANGNQVLCLHIYGQQILAFISFIIVSLTAINAYRMANRWDARKQ